MPAAPHRLCAQSGCPVLVTAPANRCQDHRVSPHQAQRERQRNHQRGSAARRGYGHGWREARRQYLIRHPYCQTCTAEGVVTLASVVDHVIPHKGNPGLFWNHANWAALCKSHHDQKTARDDGGFGRGGRVKKWEHGT